MIFWNIYFWILRICFFLVGYFNFKEECGEGFFIGVLKEDEEIVIDFGINGIGGIFLFVVELFLL